MLRDAALGAAWGAGMPRGPRASRSRPLGNCNLLAVGKDVRGQGQLRDRLSATGRVQCLSALNPETTDAPGGGWCIQTKPASAEGRMRLVLQRTTRLGAKIQTEVRVSARQCREGGP